MVATVTAKNLILFEDETAKLVLSGATLHTAATGLELTKGKILIKEHSHLSSDITTTQDGFGEDVIIDEGIIFGDGNSDNDFVCEIATGVTLEVSEGSLVYRNVLGSSWIMHQSKLFMNNDSNLYLYQNLNLGDGTMGFGYNNMLYRSIGKNITGSITSVGSIKYGSLPG